MAFCVKLKLVKLTGSLAKYQYGLCGKPFDGFFETDVTKVISGEITGETQMDEIVIVINKCTGDGEQIRSAIQAFTAVYRHYQKTGTYMEDGGYYA